MKLLIKNGRGLLNKLICITIAVALAKSPKVGSGYGEGNQ